jgi:hypothetical protein
VADEMKHPPLSEQQSLALSRAEALVLFELLSRYSDKDVLSIDHPAEQRVLWNLCARLEKMLTEPFASNFGEILERARNAVQDPRG